MSKGHRAWRVLPGLPFQSVLICIAYYFDWNNVRTMVHLVFD